MLRKIRIILACIFWVAITLLFLDFTGSLHSYFGWMAKIQLLPAFLSLNFIIVAVLLILTIVFGRIYCSVICPLGIMQDIFSWFGKKARKNRYSYSTEKKWLRRCVLVVFIVLMLVPGLNVIATLIAPYSAYGRIATNVFAPIYQFANNGLTYFAERFDSYVFYNVDVVIKSISSLIIAIVTFVVIGFLSWKNGRTWCNTICPVGTLLGFFSRYSFFKIKISDDACVHCGLCAKKCKASCINSEDRTVDYSRCVACFDCLESCNKQAIQYSFGKKSSKVTDEGAVDDSRRKFIAVSGLTLAGLAVQAQEKKVDGGLAVIQDKEIVQRTKFPVPAGAQSIRHFNDHCTACQLCISACPNQVLRPSTELQSLLKPTMSFEKGYCRPECVKCSEVCPAGAIKPVTTAEKSSIKIGTAVFVQKNCIVETDAVSCGLCERHCPVGAIVMVPKDAANSESLKIPAINTERCIGCGACENLCPARPFAAIYVEGMEKHAEL